MFPASMKRSPGLIARRVIAVIAPNMALAATAAWLDGVANSVNGVLSRNDSNPEI